MPEQVPLFSMAGGRSQNQIWQLDGGNVQNTTLGVPQLQLNPPAESLQEFKAEASNYSAEFGRTGGGLIQMTTRSGGNQFHGAAYEFLRNQALDTRTFFAQSKAPLRYNIFGASFGGPIRRDRTFFFMNYEGARRRDGSTVANTIVPRPAEVQGRFLGAGELQAARSHHRSAVSRQRHSAKPHRSDWPRFCVVLSRSERHQRSDARARRRTTSSTSPTNSRKTSAH